MEGTNNRVAGAPLVVGLGGSLGATSTSLAALDVALAAAEEEGAAVRRFSVADLALPLYGSVGEAPAAALELAEAVGRASGLVWSSPLYHGTVSGSFKNALDWLQLLADHDPPFLTGKAVGLITTAGGTQGLQGINTMEFVVRALRGWTVPLVVPVAQGWRAFDGAGRPTDRRVADQLRSLGQETARAARLLQPVPAASG
jgi:FMN reductase